jgi:sulfate/thiosulfate-binding protein
MTIMAKELCNITRSGGWAIGVLSGLVWLLSLGRGLNGQSAERLELLNVSYDPTRELFAAYNRKFQEHYQSLTGEKVTIMQSHGGSGKQARAVIEGLRADVVTLALAYDIEVIAQHRLLAADWQSRLPHDSSPYTSTIVFLTRQGNPRQIRDWGDLVSSNTQVITPNPKTSGGARWIFLAAWGYITIGQGRDDRAAEDFVTRLYRHVPVLDTGARGATTTFVQKGIGDVYLTWENEASLVLRESGVQQFTVVYPAISILAQPCVAVVDRTVNRRGKRVQAAALEYLRYLYDDEAQDLIAQQGYRPVKAPVLERYRDRYPAIRLFTLREVAGSWAEAQKRFFNEDGIFDRIYRP